MLCLLFSKGVCFRRTFADVGQVIDPASFLAWNHGDKGVTTVMEKALGQWVITEE